MPQNMVHLITPFLFHTGSWVYSQLRSIDAFRSHVFTQRHLHDPQFPWGEVFGPERFPAHRQFINKVYRRLTDDFGLFFDPWVKEIDPCVFHAHMGEEATRWLKFVKRHDKPLITTFYGMDVSKSGKIPYWYKRYQDLFAYGSKFLAEGHFLKRQLVGLGCPEEKIIVQHLGVDLPMYPTASHHSTDVVRILQVSSFREKKGIAYSLKAIADLVAQSYPVQFQLVGSGTPEAEQSVRTMIDQLGIAAHVHILGAKTHSETIRTMCDADIFLHPSVTAADGDNEGGAPVGIIEASAVGLPIVSTLHADIPEVVVDGSTGLLTNERDVQGLAGHLRYLLDRPDTRRAMGLMGREHIRKEYNLAIQVKKLEAIYGSCSGYR